MVIELLKCIENYLSYFSQWLNAWLSVIALSIAGSRGTDLNGNFLRLMTVKSANHALSSP